MAQRRSDWRRTARDDIPDLGYLPIDDTPDHNNIQRNRLVLNGQCVP